MKKTTTMLFTIEIPNDLLDEYEFEYEADIYYQDREDDWNWKRYQNVEGKLVELDDEFFREVGAIPFEYIKKWKTNEIGEALIYDYMSDGL